MDISRQLRKMYAGLNTQPSNLGVIFFNPYATNICYWIVLSEVITIFSFFNSMSYPPVEWDILPDEEFGGHLAPESTRPLTAVVLLQTDGDAKADNNFRLALGGSELLVYKGLVSSFLPLEQEDNTSITIQTWPRDIQLSYNSMCGGWFDMEHGIAAQDITVTPTAEGDDAGNAFRAKLTQDNPRSAVGAAFRWAVNASFNGKLELQLQCLPMPAGKLLGLKY
jgi:hypothetical protein